jgi:hypothetical protein
MSPMSPMSPMHPMNEPKKASNGSLNSLIDKTKNITIEHHHHYPTPEKEFNLPPQEDTNILAAKTRAFKEYSKKLAPQIFNPDTYEQMVGGAKPTESPLLAALHGFHKSSYLSPLPAQAYERQIDVDSKYVREGQYVYGAQ